MAEAEASSEEDSLLSTLIRVKTKQRANLLARLQSLHLDIDEQSQSRRQLEVKLELVDRHYNELEKLQAQLEELDESQLEEDQRVTFEHSYIEVKTALTDRIADLMGDRQTISTPQQLCSTQISSDRPKPALINLPKLQLTHFSGEQRDWLDFYNVFSTLVHNNKDLADVEKFQYLRSCLTDKASRLIQSLEVTSANYKVALELIVSRFNNSRLIFQAHMQHICDIPPFSSSTTPALRNFIDIVNVNLRAMQSLATNQQIGDAILLHLVSKKLDASTRRRWEEEISSKWGTSQSSELRMPTWADLAKFLECRCQTFNMLETAPLTNSSATKKPPPKKNQLSFVATQTTTKCSFCDASPSHSPFNCDSFNKLDPVERYIKVKRLHLCINCLGKNHCSNMCPSHHRCQHCKVSHHTLLHRTYGESSTENSKAVDNKKTALKAAKCEGEAILATALVRLCNSSGSSTIARILLYSGSQLNFVTEHIAQHLRLPRSKRSIEVVGIAGTTTKTQQMCSVQLNSLHTAYSTSIEAVILSLITSQQPTTSINVDSWKLPKNVTLADGKFYEPGGIDCLIGAGFFFDLLLVGQIKLPDSLSVLQKTKLGWIVSGIAPPHQSQQSSSPSSYPNQYSCSSSSYKAFITTSSQPHLDHLLEKFWMLECHNNPPKLLSEEEKTCEKFFEMTTTRCPISNKFIVRLPFKEDPQTLGQSYDIALKRYTSLKYKFSRTSSLFKQYAEFMDEYKAMQHMIRVDNNTLGRYFIPHHCVMKADSSTTKLRVVFDASCRTTTGKSLNDILRVGPTLQDDIFTILARFRSHKYVLMADIAKMYRQVLMHEDDTRWQSIIWSESADSTPQIYQLQTVTYGTSSAPYLATKCLLQLAKDESTRFPIGAAVTLKDFYVDNLMTGASTVNEVIAIKQQVTSLLSSGGFPLRKFASNDLTVLEDVPQEDREEVVKLGDSEYVKTLGLKWSPKQDVFIFDYNSPSSQSKATKRSILSQISSFFDPLGLLNPLIVSCKLLMQQLWQLKLDWDESVPQDVYTQWVNFQQQLLLIDNIQIPRYVPLNNTTQIHAFADASSRAYGACIYLVTHTTQGTISSLACAKSRVAPKKEVSLPRLELCATLLLAELVQLLTTIYPTESDRIHCWTDSTIALCWIRGEPSRWTVFVANRVSKIQQLTSHYTWHHVPSALNPADLVSRGATVNDIKHSQQWFQGPSFLKASEASWPSSEYNVPPDLPEQRRKRMALITEQQPDIVAEHKHIHNYARLLRIFTYVRWFCTKNHSASITPNEITTTLLMICRYIQQKLFRNELTKLQVNKPIDKNSKLSSLSPFLHNNIIRVGGRVRNSTLPFDAKHPIVLPHTHPFVNALIVHYHRKHLHAGAQTLQNILRDQFWIIGGRNIIRQVIHNCMVCYRLRPLVAEQIMGALPSARVTASYPFETTGVDYCGPFLVTQQIRGRTPIKSYIAVFICFTTKAVHFELVPDLSTVAFIAALKRFIARRGKCRVIVSDNATNFVGANRELRELLKAFISQEHIHNVEQFCRNEGIEWRFIPPRSPHFGGLWESAVKLAKNHLRRVVGVHILSHDELHTVVCQAEAIVNSRPLTPISSDPNDLRPLTPGHFLVQRMLTTVPEPPPTSEKIIAIKRYQIVHHIQQQFWDRWHQDYLKELQKRTKWRTAQTNIKVDDLVLLKEESTPPLKWPIGRVTKVSPGDDELVRVVEVRTSDGTCKRAITRVCKLPSADETY